MNAIRTSSIALAVGCIFVAATASAAPLIVDTFGVAPDPNPIAGSGSSWSYNVPINNAVTLPAGGPFASRVVQSTYQNPSSAMWGAASLFSWSYGITGGEMALATGTNGGGANASQSMSSSWYTFDLPNLVYVPADLSAYDSIELDVEAANLVPGGSVSFVFEMEGMPFFGAPGYWKLGWNLGYDDGTISLDFGAPDTTSGTPDFTQVRQVGFSMYFSDSTPIDAYSWNYSLSEVRLVAEEVIPEPASAMLLGLAGLMLLKRTRKP